MRLFSPVLREQDVVLRWFEMFDFIEHILDPRFWIDAVKAISDEEGIIA